MMMSSLIQLPTETPPQLMPCTKLPAKLSLQKHKYRATASRVMRSFCLWVWVWGCSGIGACWHGGVRGVGIIYFLDWIGSIHGAERSPLDRRFMNLFVFITP